MIRDLEKLDATIHVFDPDIAIEAIKPKAFRPPADWAKRGEMSRFVLGILRQAAEPLTTRNIALQKLLDRALDENDQRLLRLMTKRVGVSLRHKRDKGIVVEAWAGAVHGVGAGELRGNNAEPLSRAARAPASVAPTTPIQYEYCPCEDPY